MKIIAIVATNQQGAIGYKNKLLFTSKVDMQHFRRKTNGCIVLMGRKTYESIGKPLAGRINIILSKDSNFNPEGVTVFRSLQAFLDAYKCSDATVFIIGGSEIYEATKHIWSEIYLTVFWKEVENADTFFPKWLNKNWVIESLEQVEENGTLIEFSHYKKVGHAYRINI